MKKKVLLWASVLTFLTFSVQVFAQEEGPLEKLARFLFIKIPEAAASADDLFVMVMRFSIWILVFALMFTGVNRVFKENRNAAIAISAVLATISVLGIPRQLILGVWVAYSQIVAIALVIAPALLGLWLNSTVFVGPTRLHKIIRGLVYLIIGFVLGVLLRSASATGIATYQQLVDYGYIGVLITVIVGLISLLAGLFGGTTSPELALAALTKKEELREKSEFERIESQVAGTAQEATAEQQAAQGLAQSASGVSSYITQKVMPAASSVAAALQGLQKEQQQLLPEEQTKFQTLVKELKNAISYHTGIVDEYNHFVKQHKTLEVGLANAERTYIKNLEEHRKFTNNLNRFASQLSKRKISKLPEFIYRVQNLLQRAEEIQLGLETLKIEFDHKKVMLKDIDSNLRKVKSDINYIDGLLNPLKPVASWTTFPTIRKILGVVPGINKFVGSAEVLQEKYNSIRAGMSATAGLLGGLDLAKTILSPLLEFGKKISALNAEFAILSEELAKAEAEASKYTET